MMECMVVTCNLRPIDQTFHGEGCGDHCRLLCVPIGQVSRAVSSHSVGQARQDVSKNERHLQ